MPDAIRTSITIGRPASEVWAALTDWERAPAWMNGIDSMSAAGSTEPGTVLTFHARGKERTSTIVDLDEGRSITLRSAQGGVTADYTYTVETIDATSTRLSLVAACQTSLLWKPYGPLLRWLVRRTDGGQPTALKALVETG